MTVVSDTTPLRYLTLLGRIDLLPQLFGGVIHHGGGKEGMAGLPCGDRTVAAGNEFPSDGCRSASSMGKQLGNAVSGGWRHASHRPSHARRSRPLLHSHRKFALFARILQRWLARVRKACIFPPL